MNKKQGKFQIEIGGKKICGHFSMTFLHLLTELRGIELSEISQVITSKPKLKDLSDILYCAHQAHCLRPQNEDCDFTNEFDFLDFLGEEGFFQDEKQIATVYDALANSQMFQNESNQGIPRKVKKSTSAPN